MKAIGTAFMPIALKLASAIGLCITRTFRPFMSAMLLSGRLLFDMLRNAPPAQTRPCMPMSSRLSSSLLPTGPSSTWAASASEPNRNGKSKICSSFLREAIGETAPR